ncbi:MAG: D-alanyl-D-alanine carboxypeptidase family protein [Burkholderiales bacterium]
MKKTVVLLLAIIILFSFSNTAHAETLTSQAKSYILIDAGSGNVLLEKDADTQLPCASLIKTMSLLLFCEAEKSGRLSLNDTVTISREAAAKGGTQVFLDANTTHTVEDLLKAVTVCSANDATAALAEKVAGSEEAFVEMMNKKAEVMGIAQNFKNSTGLEADGQTMSARDISAICRELVKYDLIRKWSTIWMENYKHPDGRETEMVNTNRLVKYYAGCDGICTGSSQTAGYCIAATVKRGGGRYIFVSLGCPNSSTRFDEAGKAFDYAYAGFTAKTLVTEGQTLAKNLQVAGGTSPYVDVYAKENFSALVEKGKENALEKELVLLENVTAPLKEGDTVGYLRILLDGKEIGRVDAIIKQDIDVLDYRNSLKRIFVWWLFA